MNPTRLSRVEAALRTVLDFNAACNRHDIPEMMQLLSDTCILEHYAPAPDGNVYSGKEAITQFWQDFFNKSSKAHIQIEDAFGLGNHCILRWRYEWEDTPGTKKHLRGVDIFLVSSGLIIEQRSYVKGL